MERDDVNNPRHYTDGGIETIDFIEAKELNYRLGNVVKYITRAGKKDDALQDLKKAQWYLNREIAKVEGNECAKAGTLAPSRNFSAERPLRFTLG